MQLPSIKLQSKFSSSSEGVIYGCFQQISEASAKKGAKNSSTSAPTFAGKKNKEVESLLARVHEGGTFKGAKDEVEFLRFYESSGTPNTCLLGLGESSKLDPEILRRAGAVLALRQKKEKIKLLTLNAEGIFKVSPKNVEYAIQAFCEGYLMAPYEYLEHKKKNPKHFGDFGLEIVGLNGKGAQSAVDKAAGLSAAVYFARSLGDSPPNYMTPNLLTKTIEKMSKEVGSIKCTHWNEARLIKENCGLLVGVGEGSAEESRLIFLEYRGGKKSDKPIALVGKAVTFDTGGISLKPASRMEEMKYDMMGSATVAGIFYAAAKLKLKVNLNGYIASAENMPGAKAQKPGDIKYSRSGKSVEIINTDAEGRLCMADAIEVAQEHNPCALLDFATLTGAVLVALGTTTTGIMGNSDELIDRLYDSADHTGEKVWELPLYEEFEEYMRSNFADIKNSSDIREAGSSKAGTFLKFFVDKNLPWVHCDIAGTAWYRRDVPYHPRKTASGAMVRNICQMLESWKPI